MALGNYGIKRPADVSPEDVEIIVHTTNQIGILQLILL